MVWHTGISLFIPGIAEEASSKMPLRGGCKIHPAPVCGELSMSEEQMAALA